MPSDKKEGTRERGLWDSVVLTCDFGIRCQESYSAGVLKWLSRKTWLQCSHTVVWSQECGSSHNSLIFRMCTIVTDSSSNVTHSAFVEKKVQGDHSTQAVLYIC